MRKARRWSRPGFEMGLTGFVWGRFVLGAYLASMSSLP